MSPFAGSVEPSAQPCPPAVPLDSAPESQSSAGCRLRRWGPVGPTGCLADALRQDENRIRDLFSEHTRCLSNLPLPICEPRTPASLPCSRPTASNGGQHSHSQLSLVRRSQHGCLLPRKSLSLGDCFGGARMSTRSAGKLKLPASQATARPVPTSGVLVFAKNRASSAVSADTAS